LPTTLVWRIPLGFQSIQQIAKVPVAQEGLRGVKRRNREKHAMEIPLGFVSSYHD